MATWRRGHKAMEKGTRKEVDIENQQKMEGNIKFLSASYSNIQSCLRFFDTKSAAIFTVNAFLLKFLFEKFSEIASCKNTLLDILFFISILCSLASIIHSLLTIWPSDPPKSKSNFTLLFPSLHPNTLLRLKENNKSLCNIATKKAKGLNTDKIAESYSCQLGHLGESLSKKISHLQISLSFLISSIALSIISSCIYILLYFI